MLSVSAVDDPDSESDPHYQTSVDSLLNIAAEYGVLANDVGTALAVSAHDDHSSLGADVTVHDDGSVAYDPTNSPTLRSLAAGEVAFDTFSYSVSGGGVADGLFAIDVFQVAPAAGTNDHDLDTTSETLAIWNALDLGVVVPGLVSLGSKTYYVSQRLNDQEGIVNFGSAGGVLNGGGGRFTPNQGYESINSDGPGGTAGTLAGGDDFSVRARTFIRFDVAGTYTIAVGSDDGRRLSLSRADGGAFSFVAAGGQLTNFQPGDSVLHYEGTSGHNWSLGVFSVNSGDVLALDTFFFERTGPDSFEVAIKSGSDTAFGLGTDGFSLLTEGALGGTVHLSSTLAPPVPEVDSATVRIHVVGTNDAPTLAGDQLTVGEDAAVTVAFLGDDVDSDDDAGSLSYQVISAPLAGELHVNDDGTFTFTAAGNFDSLADGSVANVEFTVVAVDRHGAMSAPATVAVQVVGRNDAPQLVSPVSNVVVNQNATATAIPLAGHFADPDAGDTLTLAAASSNGKLVQTRIVDGRLVLAYRPNTYGQASITVTATDSRGASVSHSFAVHVRSPQEQVKVIADQLRELRHAGELSKGEFQALEKKLAEASRQLSKSQTKAAVNSVQAFVHQVSALVRSRRLDASDGRQLIGWSQDLIESLNNPPRLVIGNFGVPNGFLQSLQHLIRWLSIRW
jgi:VCBS repeat-containing protein